MKSVHEEGGDRSEGVPAEGTGLDLTQRVMPVLMRGVGGSRQLLNRGGIRYINIVPRGGERIR